MGAAIDTGGGGGKSRNVELNVVPFIDLMSCLTAFLLVTAVWTNLAQMNVKPKGIGRDVEKVLDEEPPPNISVLLTSNDVWIGTSEQGGARKQIANAGVNVYDWEALEDTLRDFKEGEFAARDDIEIAAEDEVQYEYLIGAMDTAVSSGFRNVGFVDPMSLSVRFKQ